MQQLEIEKIKQDENQPRKIFSKKHIEGLAESIKTEGIINPIEIDETNKIITGECRWRAAKLAGLKTVPVQLNNTRMSEYERLRRQIAENIHQSGSQEEAMNPIDTAEGYKRLLEMMGWTPSKAALHGRENGRFTGDEYVKKLSEEIGVTRQMIYDYLKLLDQPDFVIQKVREGQAFTTYVEADSAPEEHKIPIKKRIAEGDLISRSQVRDEVNRINKFPDLAEINLVNNTEEIGDEVRRIIRSVTQLGLALQDTPLDKLLPHQQRRVAQNLSWLMKKIMEYIGKNETKVIEGK